MRKLEAALALGLFVTLTVGSIPIGSAYASTGYRILIAYADGYGSANTLHDHLRAQPGVVAVDRFNAQSGTPTPSQLQAYDLVFTFSNAPYADGTKFGNNLADYQDSGGIVVGNFGSFSSNVPAQFPILGRWLSGGYSPYAYASVVLSTPVTLGTNDGQQPLMQGVATLNAVSRLPVTLATGARQAAAYSDGSSAIAYKTTNGHTAVGLSAYLGDQPGLYGAGDYPRVIVNTLTWLKDIQPFNPNLDQFRRPNGPVGPSWTGNTDPGFFSILNNSVQVLNSGFMLWNGGSNPVFNARQEAYFTFTKVGTAAAGVTDQDLLLKVTGPTQGTTSPGSALIEVQYDATNKAVYICTFDQAGAGWVTQATIPNQTFSTGDRFGAKAFDDGSVFAYKNGFRIGSVNVAAANPDATPWPLTYVKGGGRIGVWFIGNNGFTPNDASVTNLGGGSLP